VIYWISLAFTPLTIWAILKLPEKPKPYAAVTDGTNTDVSAGNPRGAQRAVLLAIALWLAASFAFGFYYQPLFVFSERLGDRIGLSLEQVGTVLAVSTLLGVIGSAAVSLQGDRFGRAGPIVIGAMGGLAVCLLLYLSPSVPNYWIGLSLFSIVWSYLPCFIQGYIAIADRSGRAIVAAQFVNVGGAALATAILGALITRAGLDIAVYVGMAGIVATGALALCGAAFYAGRRTP
jgi:hypothetical protein